MKGAIYVLEGWYRSGKHGVKKAEYKIVTRVVKDIEVVKVQQEPPLTDRELRDGDSVTWAEGLEWTLYKGTVSYARETMTVMGWSFDENPPLLWGCDTDYGETSGRITRWAWLGNSDNRIPTGSDLPDYLEDKIKKGEAFIDGDFVVMPTTARNSVAYGIISRKFGWETAAAVTAPARRKKS